ncbi:MAG: STAS domain-containing protein [Pseudomonadota bacterium]|nr:STAS domain-containing protein [Pseudomonadota bacterium]
MIEHPTSDAPAVGGFTTSEKGWCYAGTLTFDDAADVFAASKAMPLPANGIVDFSAMLHADSAALAIIIALKRRATAEGRALSATGLPSTLRSLAVVYGVDHLLD